MYNMCPTLFLAIFYDLGLDKDVFPTSFHTYSHCRFKPINLTKALTN